MATMRIHSLTPGVGLVSPDDVNLATIGADPLRRDEGIVYRLLNADGKCIYIGFTTSPLNRWQAHSRKHWWGEVAAIYYVREFRSRRALEVEREDIRAERPPRNRTVRH